MGSPRHSHLLRAFEGWADLSAKDSEGYVPLYRVRNCADSVKLSVAAFFATPIYAVLTVAYHVARIAIVSLYLFGRIFYDGIKEGSFSLASKRFCQIFEQAWLSLSTILRTPFCATGFMLGHLANICFDPARYKIGDGLNGKKFAAMCERFWNRDIPIDLSMDVYGNFKKGRYAFEGAGDPDKLGSSGFYLTGCMQPFALAKLDEKDALIEIKSPGGNAKLRTVAWNTNPGIGSCSKPGC